MELKETSFYPHIVERFIAEAESYLPGYDFAYSIGGSKSLRTMIKEIEKKLGSPTMFSGKYIPDLKLDILIGIKSPEEKVHLILIEAKYCKNLKLDDYSQLTGYLQVAKYIRYGVLVLVVKNPESSALSTDFADIIRMNNLIMEWEMLVSNGSISQYQFSVGICTYVLHNGIDWIPTNYTNCIKNFEDLSHKLSLE